MVSDGRTTIMVRNIPNKYTQEMLLDLFEKNHKKKFDFFYLPIDYTVHIFLFRIIAMSVMLFWTSYIPNSSSTFIKNSIKEDGENSTLAKFVKSVMPEFKELLNCKITSNTQMFFNKGKEDSDLWLVSDHSRKIFLPWFKDNKINTHPKTINPEW